MIAVRLSFCLLSVIAACGGDDLLTRARNGDRDARYRLAIHLWSKGDKTEAVAWALCARRGVEFMRKHEGVDFALALERAVVLSGQYGPPLTQFEKDRVEIQLHSMKVYELARKERRTTRVGAVEGYPGWSYETDLDKNTLTIRVFYNGSPALPEMKEVVAE